MQDRSFWKTVVTGAAFLLLATFVPSILNHGRAEDASVVQTTEEKREEESPPPVRAMDEMVEEAVSTEADAQSQFDEWNEERDALLEEARSLNYELQWLELQQGKLVRYVAANNEKITEMEEALARYAVIALELENALLRDLVRLEKTVVESPPFLSRERGTRLRFLKESLDDPEIHIGEKYRRFTEGLNAEVEYGRKLEMVNELGVLDGDEMDLISIRAGRVGYYCLTMDRNRGGVWKDGAGGFVSLHGDELQAIKDVELMLQTGQYYNLAVLPAKPEAQ